MSRQATFYLTTNAFTVELFLNHNASVRAIQMPRKSCGLSVSGFEIALTHQLCRLTPCERRSVLTNEELPVMSKFV